MLKFTTTLFLIYAIVTISLTLPAAAQVTTKGAETVAEQSATKPDLWKTIAENERQYNARIASPTAKELDRLNRQTNNPGKWTKKEKTWIVLGIIGFAALIFVLVKYGKDCIRSSPTGCNPGVDEPCTCLEYAKKS